MNSTSRKTFLLCLCLLVAVVWTGCNRTEEATGEPDSSPEERVWLNREGENDYHGTEPSREGMARSPLSGLWIPEEDAARRPVSVMINNMKKALPQSGISQAEIIYETLAEGEITRLLAVFQTLDSEKIGPVRSARHYYLDFAFDHDALYVHYGGSPQAYNDVVVLKSPALNGLSYLDEIMCWRDPARMAIRGMYEHSVYTNGEKLRQAWDTVGYRYETDQPPMFAFSEKPVELTGQRAEMVVLPFSRSYIGEFRWDPGLNQYLRSMSGNDQIDEETGEVLRVTNLLVQFTDIWVIAGDPAGRRDMTLIGSGAGLYITGGKMVPVHWSKADHWTSTRWTLESGEPLVMSPGKTWISVFPKNRSPEIS
mgnify:CR=1 FL=1